jgi:hypothetical protein
MLSQSKFASIEQDAPSKVPMLLPRDIMPTVMHMYKNACSGHFDMKDVAKDKQVHRILAGLHNSHIQDWVGIYHECLLEMTFANFLAEFKISYLPKDWEEITCIELLQMMQGEDNFCDFSVQVQAKNSTFSGTTSHMDKMQLCHCIEASVNTTLALHCHLKKVVSQNPLAKWLDDVNHINGLISAERANFDALTKSLVRLQGTPMC